MKWIREETTTKGVDPTVVVTWKADGIEITEFQNVYTTVVAISDLVDDSVVGRLGKELHIAKEELYESEQQVRELQKQIAEWED